MRLVIGSVTVILPLARHLNVTDVLSIIMALFVFALI
jgi:hypothetical protein